MLFKTATLLAGLPLLTATVNAAPSNWQLPFSKTIFRTSTHPGTSPEDVIDLSKYTIAEILDRQLKCGGPHHNPDCDEEDQRVVSLLGGGGGDHGDNPHRAPLHKLAWIVNRTEEIQDYLNQTDISVTLFAPDDAALTPPGHGGEHGPGHGHHHHHHDHHDHDHKHEHEHEVESLSEDFPVNHPFFSYAEDLASFEAAKEGDHDGDSDEDKERKRRFLKKLITAILRYHISTEKLPFNELRDKQTIPTSLNQTRDVGVPFRIRASPSLELLPPPPRYNVALNFYAKLRPGPSALAKNGVIYLVSAPLLPPLPPVDSLLTFPIPFSTLTSAIQQTELDHALAPYLHSHEHHDKNAALASLVEGGVDANEPAAIAMSVLEEIIEEARQTMDLPKSDTFEAFPFTIFAPTNLAFAKIPFRIRAFLFSPFGKQYLKKVLQYHVVPQQIFHSDYYLNATRGYKDSSASEQVFETLRTAADRLPFKLGHKEDRHEPTSLGSTGFNFPRFGRGGDRPRKDMPKPPRFAPPSEKAPHSVDAKKYILPTLLGNAKNESIAVNVYEYRKGFGKGPLVKKIAVGNTEQDEHEYSNVVVADGVAWGGAVHVINSLIKPIFPHNHDDHDEHHGQSASYIEELAYLKALWE